MVDADLKMLLNHIKDVKQNVINEGYFFNHYSEHLNKHYHLLYHSSVLKVFQFSAIVEHTGNLTAKSKRVPSPFTLIMK